MSEAYIPLSVPNFCGNERDYVLDAVVSEWVSTGGSKVAGFEEAFAAYVGMPRAVACNSGTSAIHLAFLAADVRQGDEVLVPALTFIAAVNPVRYVNAVPVFLGCDDSLCLSPAILAGFLQNNCEKRAGGTYNKTSCRRVAAIEVVHVFGNLADMPAIMSLAKEYGLAVIEDATEAIGTRYETGPYAGKMAGTIGDAGAYSFNGNKIITTGSGGMLVSNHADWAAHAKHLSTQAKSDEVRYTHDEVGYNYRMTNLQAALGLAQMESLEAFIARKHALYDIYHKNLDGKNGLAILLFREGTRPNKWFFSLCLTSGGVERREALMAALAGQRIQTRPIWGLINEQPPYQGCEIHGLDAARQYVDSILNLPCSTGMTDEEALRVCRAVLELTE